MSRRDLFRSRSVVALLGAEVISTTGAQMTWIALPWFVLVTTGSATKMSFVVAAAHFIATLSLARDGAFSPTGAFGQAAGFIYLAWMLGTNALDERITALPAISGDELIYRTDSRLFCISRPNGG